IKKNWIDSGKVKWIYRDLPTPPIGAALSGAMLAQCQGDKKYFQMMSLFFKTQRKWVLASDPRAELIKLAGISGMTASAAEACLKRQDLLEALNKRAEEGGKDY